MKLRQKTMKLSEKTLNILKYASRYDKKGTARRDIMKILHYAVLLMHFNDKNAKRETYPQ